MVTPGEGGLGYRGAGGASRVPGRNSGARACPGGWVSAGPASVTDTQLLKLLLKNEERGLWGLQYAVYR